MAEDQAPVFPRGDWSISVPNGDQQCGDTLPRPAYRQQRRRVVCFPGHREERRDACFCRQRSRPQAGYLRTADRDPFARDHLRARRRSAGRPAREGRDPGRILFTGVDGGSTGHQHGLHLPAKRRNHGR
ncbi:MAG: hypothetical protein COZ05_12395, partial [Armatimonadetes bacterium CG_4_10_14_3_um_filter_59_10]